MWGVDGDYFFHDPGARQKNKYTSSASRVHSLGQGGGTGRQDAGQRMRMNSPVAGLRVPGPGERAELSRYHQLSADMSAGRTEAGKLHLLFLGDFYTHSLLSRGKKRECPGTELMPGAGLALDV